MIPIKTKEEIEIMREGGEKLRKILSQLLAEVRVGKTGMDIERLAIDLIAKAGGKASFQMVPNYKWATCICVNDGVVHGVPNEIPFQEGNVVGVDIGMYYKGLHTDTSFTLSVKENPKSKIQNPKIEEFLKTGKKALERAIKQVKPGNRVGHISKAIQETIEKEDYSVVRELIGHGVGRKLHEEPEIPGFLSTPIEKTPLLKERITLAIEIIYNMGKADIYIDKKDGWTVRTKDGKISALFEKTVAVTHGGFLVLT